MYIYIHTHKHTNTNANIYTQNNKLLQNLVLFLAVLYWDFNKDIYLLSAIIRIYENSLEWKHISSKIDEIHFLNFSEIRTLN